MSGFEGEAPEQPHFVVWRDKKGLNVEAFPRGCMMGIVTDQHRPDEFCRMVLVDVSRQRITFRCTCDPNCTMVFTYRLTARGQHPRRR